MVALVSEVGVDVVDSESINCPVRAADHRQKMTDLIVKRHKVDPEIDLKSSRRQIRGRVISKNHYLSTGCRIIDVKSSHLVGRTMPLMARS